MMSKKLVAAAGLLALILGVKDTPHSTEQPQMNYREVRTEPKLWSGYIRLLAHEMNIPEYVSVTVTPRREYKGRTNDENSDDALMSTVPETQELGSGRKSTIHVFEPTFTHLKMQTDDDVRSHLAHEVEHAGQFYRGIVYHSGRRVTLEDFIAGEKNGESLYSQMALDAVLELGACNVHARMKMSPGVAANVLKNYAHAFAQFVIYGENLDPAFYRDTINEYFRKWMLKGGIVGATQDESGKDRYFMRTLDMDLMLPAGIPPPRR